MLISFEGQDGSGKTALLTAVHGALGRREIPSVVIEEFSSSPYGQRLVEAVARDKFLRPVAGEATTPLTRALEIVADLYHQDEREIGPALRRGEVVLKDRHVDTVVYTLAPTLAASGAVTNEGRALTWLTMLCDELRHRPDLTIYTAVTLPVRLRRIATRTRDLAEDRGSDVSAEDIGVFAARERIAWRLISEEPGRFLVVDNGDRPLSDSARTIVDAICTRHELEDSRKEAQ